MKFAVVKKWYFILLCAVALALIVFAIYYFAVIRPQKIEQKRYEEIFRAYHEQKYEEYEKENQKYADYEVDVAFIGDSLTDRYDLENYYPQYITANRGINGDTTFDVEKRLQLSLYDLKPKVVVMLIGANNLDTMFQNYEAILQGIQENLPQTKVVLLSLTAMNGEEWGRNNPLAAYNNVKIKLLAERYGYEFIDLFSALYDVSAGEAYADYTLDGGHLSHLGYTKVTEQITPVLKEILGR